MIKLTQKEELILKKIRSYLEKIQKKTNAWIVGGWVRDKLLRKESADIDISLDNMMGYEFAVGLRDFLNGKNKVGLVNRNPIQSKHLETAILNVEGLNIEFVNLRSEKYAQESRIPEVKFGTLIEDSLRRDITINSLYYNIRTNQIEDPSNMGLNDLKNKIIRTPTCAFQTFKDDPLRILRVIRFAARFDYTLDDKIREALILYKDLLFKNLGNKVSRERIGSEIIKIFLFNHSKFQKALNLFGEMEIYEVLIKFPENYFLSIENEKLIKSKIKKQMLRKDFPLIELNWIAVNYLDHWNYGSLNEKKLLAWNLIFCLWPFVLEFYGKNGKKKKPLIEYIVRESLKMCKVVVSYCVSIMKAIKEFIKLLAVKSNKSKQEILEEILLDNEIIIEFKNLNFDEIGKIVEDLGDFWIEGLTILFTLNNLSKSLEGFFLKLKETGFNNYWNEKLPLDGNEIIQVFKDHKIKLDLKLVGKLINSLKIWKIQNNINSKEDLKKELIFLYDKIITINEVEKKV